MIRASRFKPYKGKDPFVLESLPNKWSKTRTLKFESNFDYDFDYGSDSDDSDKSSWESVSKKPSSKKDKKRLADEIDSASDAESLTGFPSDFRSCDDDNQVEGYEAQSSHDTAELKSLGDLGHALLQSSLDREVFHLEASRYHQDKFTNTGFSGYTDIHAELVKAVSSSPSSNTLFRWIHMKDGSLDFGAFERSIEELPGLTHQDTMEVKKLLRQVERPPIHPRNTSRGVRGRLLTPTTRARESVFDAVTKFRHDYIFFSMPYFQHSKYSGLKSAHPDCIITSLPLIQSQHPSTTMKRELRQAVCRLPGAQANYCYHIDTFWCLIIRDKYIVTYAPRLSAMELQGNRIKMHEAPLEKSLPAADGKQTFLQVIDNDSLFLVPLIQCQTWFQLVQTFYQRQHGGFFGEYAIVMWNGRQVDYKGWAALIQHAEKHPTRVYVYHRARPMTRHLPSPIADIDVHMPSTSAAPKSLKGKHSSDGELVSRDELRGSISLSNYLAEFHALKWIAVKRAVSGDFFVENARTVPKTDLSTPQSRQALHEKVESFLFDLHSYMESHPSPLIGKPYRKCATKTLKETEQALADMVKDASDDSSIIDMRMEYLAASKALFIGFLPEEQESLVSSKYWGAVYTVITEPWRPGKRAHLLKKLTMFAKDMLRVRAQLTQGKGPNPMEVDLPLEFVKSWIYLLLCHINWITETKPIAAKHLKKHRVLFKDALHAVGSIVDGEPIAKLQAPLPSDLLALLVKRMLPGPNGDFPRVVDTYKDYRTNLTTRIKDTSLSRSIRIEIFEFIDELSISTIHISKQNEVLRALCFHFRRIYQWEDEEPACIKLLSALQTQQQLASMELIRLRDEMNNLITQNPENKGSSPQGQEIAIYALAIVTIIYLPISTVSSVFGINAGDDGDIEHGQWAFWAVALPVTVITAMVAFYGASVLSPRKLQPLPPSPGPYQPLGAPRMPPGWSGPGSRPLGARPPVGGPPVGGPPVPGPPVPGPPVPGPPVPAPVTGAVPGRGPRPFPQPQ